MSAGDPFGPLASTGRLPRTTYVLIVPEQPRYGVDEQRSWCCRSCGERFITKAGIGQLQPIELSADCQLRYTGTCEDELLAPS